MTAQAQAQAQAQLQPPRLIITPSTPLLADTFDHDASASFPSSSGSRHVHAQASSLPTISEKRSSRSRSGSRSSAALSSSSSSSSRSPPHDTKRLSSAVYLAPPPHLASPMTGKRPLRSPLISILFIGFTLMLLLSTAFCTSDTSVRFLEMQQEKFRSLREKGGNAFALTLGGLDKGRKDFVAGGMVASTAPGHNHDHDHDADVISAKPEGNEGYVGEDGLIMSNEEWEHYTSTIGGPAITMSGQVWDIEW
ncbi:hypothetical protein IAU59_007278 [Kwoniella sp. CBS 9459]